MGSHAQGSGFSRADVVRTCDACCSRILPQRQRRLLAPGHEKRCTRTNRRHKTPHRHSGKLASTELWDPPRYLASHKQHVLEQRLGHSSDDAVAHSNFVWNDQLAGATTRWLRQFRHTACWRGVGCPRCGCCPCAWVCGGSVAGPTPPPSPRTGLTGNICAQVFALLSAFGVSLLKRRGRNGMTMLGAAGCDNAATARYCVCAPMRVPNVRGGVHCSSGTTLLRSALHCQQLQSSTATRRRLNTMAAAAQQLIPASRHRLVCK